MHPFIGYLRKNQHPAAPTKLDIEAQFWQHEQSDREEVCYICDKPKLDHLKENSDGKEDQARDELYVDAVVTRLERATSLSSQFKLTALKIEMQLDQKDKAIYNNKVANA